MKVLLLALTLVLTVSAQSAKPLPTAKPPANVTVTRGSGGSVQTPLGYDIFINKGSSMEREWITIHDSASPLGLPGTIGVKTIYVRERSVGEFNYSARFAVEATESVSAFELRFLLFDIWGNHLRTLSLTEVTDFEGAKEFTGGWKVYSENEVSDYYASIAFVARVRTKAGKIFEPSLLPVLEEARKFSRKFSPENLEPKPQKP